MWSRPIQQHGTRLEMATGSILPTRISSSVLSSC
uniref:Uncharacterized protein n=1 Tax=Setaria italica TaxID=4555 RepID=K4ANV3_SETIT